ncbi:MAG: hypothetical protein HY959_03675 [Ignavibacteriae bacterium]|nr:hypothetical protein [Ignavibacteriota bacterium]
MNYKEVLDKACKELLNLKGQILDVLDVKKPHSLAYGQHLAKVISKISPLIGNMIEFSIIEQLNSLDWKGLGVWIRQDPGFPDALFKSKLEPQPGIEIKTWFPLATEITARFKDSVSHFDNNQINVALVAWLPEFLIYGKPKIIDVWIGSAKSVAESRDKHYHNPPDYLVFEPEDTSSRTQNLQQTNTNGYKFQDSASDFAKAEKEVLSWGKDGKVFNSSKEYQAKIKTLLGKYSYRLDTNFAKMDRIEHKELEEFKSKILKIKIDNKTIKDWAGLVTSDDKVIENMVKEII